MLFILVSNSDGKVDLEGKVRLRSVPTERMQIVCSPAEFLMQIGPARKVLHCILRALCTQTCSRWSDPFLEVRFVMTIVRVSGRPSLLITEWFVGREVLF